MIRQFVSYSDHLQLLIKICCSSYECKRA